MFKQSYNRAVFQVRLETVTPLLIRAGDAGLTPAAADLACVRTHHGRHGSTVYIPGSSLKGVLRSAAEASVRGRKFIGNTKGACDPLDTKSSCGGTRSDESKPASHVVHRTHCLACRLFGSLKMKGRAGIRDLFPWTEKSEATPTLMAGGANHVRANRIELRQGVSINRISGSVENGPFDQEMVPAGVSFFGDIALENFQIWQIGLLAQAFDEVNEGFAQLGSSKSRGLGVARISVAAILHEQPAHAARFPVGTGLLVSEQERQDYGLLPDYQLPDSEGVVRGLSRRFTIVEEPKINEWLSKGLAALGSLQ